MAGGTLDLAGQRRYDHAQSGVLKQLKIIGDGR